MIICEHKFGRGCKDGYQYCTKCHLATMPLVQQRSAPCYHSWEIFKEVTQSGNKGVVVGRVIRCMLCGDLKYIGHS